MADEWELANGLDPENPEDRNRCNREGYTALEVYLAHLMGETISNDFTTNITSTIQEEVSIYPTAVDEYLYVNSIGTQVANVHITSIDGKRVCSFSNIGEAIYLGSLPKGYYLVSVELNKEQAKHFKIIKS